MKKLSSMAGLDILLEKIATFAESAPGKKAILGLKPDLSIEKRTAVFKNLSEIEQISSLIPSLSITQEVSAPERNKILSGRKLLYYKKALNITKEIKKILTEHKLLEKFNQSLDSIQSLYKEIERFIDENGNIIPNSTPLLKSLYDEKFSMEKKIEKKLEGFLIEKEYLLQDKIITTRQGRTVLPFKYNRKDEIEGIIVDLSRTQNTAFIEPGEIVTLNNRISEIEKDISSEKKRILKELTKKVRKNFAAIKKNIETLTEIDSLKARNLYAREFNCINPSFSEKSILRLKNCYHPLLLVEKKDIEALDLEIGEKERILLVSGPNAGGKTVMLKNLAINVLSSFSGIPIPAKEGTEIGFFSNVLGIIEDEQSIEENLSSFSSYLVKLKEILNKTDQNTLILLDELGGNTDPVEGSALSIALLNELKKQKSLVITTTHLSSLKFYAEEHKEMINGSMEYENGPTYHLQLGMPGGSRAIATAEKFGLPKHIINEAKKHIDSEVFQAEKLIEELSTRNRKLREQEQEIEILEKDLSKLKSEYDKKMKNIKEEKKQILKKAKEEAEETINEARSTVEKTIKEIKENKASKKSIKRYKETFSNISKKQQENKETYKPSKKLSEISYHVDTNIPLEISVRGMTKEDAWKTTDKFLDKAIVADYTSVRILHGKGSWILRNMIHKKLGEDPRIERIETPPHYEGGEGVTIAVLK
jgi:DNA mismatch repair protein MutS2